MADRDEGNSTNEVACGGKSMNDDLKVYLTTALARLERYSEKIRKQQGLSKKVLNQKMLAELIKEQFPNEDSRSSNRTSR